MKHDVFISYRRDGGEALAQLLRDKLTDRGYSVFYDIESLKSGPFDAKLLRKIEECEDVLVVLPPQALDRCIYDEDWVRQEIRHAIRHGKNIIPVMMRGFAFPHSLPEDIQRISSMNGVSFETMEYLDARVDKIVSMLRSGSNGPVEKKRSDKKSRIYNVCSLGSCDYDNHFPTDGYYSEVINRDRYPMVYFHLTTALMDAETVRSGMRIYNEEDMLACEHVSDIEWKPNYTRISKSWCLRGRDGSFVKAGVYRAEFWIDDSAVYEYYFKVTSDGSAELGDIRKHSTAQTASNGQKIMREKLEKKLSRPRGFLWNLLATVGYVAAMYGMIDEIAPLAVFGLALLAVSVVLLVRYTKRYVWNNWAGAMLLSAIGCGYYGLYLLITSVIWLFKHKQWKQSLEELQE